MNRIRWFRIACYALAAAMAATAAWHVNRAAVNVPFWDDFDRVLGFLLRIDEAPGFWSRVGLTFDFHNEHCPAVGRSLVRAFVGIAGRPDFRVLAMGSASIMIVVAGMIFLPVRDRDQRAAACFFAAVFLFNLQHYESFFWAGAGLDQLGAAALSLGAVWTLRRASPWNLSAAIILGALAALTLAHGLLVFPVGLLVLLLERRKGAAAAWAALGTIVIVAWLAGYMTRATGGPSPENGSLAGAVRYWLGLLGAPLCFGSRAAAVCIGAGLVGGAFVAWRLRALDRHRYHAAALLFLAGSLALFAVGRAPLAPDDFLVSRYRVLSGSIIAVLAWMLWVEALGWRRGRWIQAGLMAACLALFGEQALSHSWRSAAYRDRRLVAAAWYADQGTLAGSPVPLYYDIPKADRILKECAAAGIYDLAEFGRTAPRIDRVPRSVLGGKVLVEGPGE